MCGSSVNVSYDVNIEYGLKLHWKDEEGAVCAGHCSWECVCVCMCVCV